MPPFRSSYLVQVQIVGHEDLEMARAYQDHITRITADREFLLKNGFDFNKETKYYTKEDITVAHVIFTRPALNMYGQPDGIMYDDRGHGIVESKICNPTKEDEISSKVTLLNTAHAF